MLIDSYKLMNDLSNDLISCSLMLDKKDCNNVDRAKLVAKMNVYRALIEKLDNGYYSYSSNALEDAVYNIDDYISDNVG